MHCILRRSKTKYKFGTNKSLYMTAWKLAVEIYHTQKLIFFWFTSTRLTECVFILFATLASKGIKSIKLLSSGGVISTKDSSGVHHINTAKFSVIPTYYDFRKLTVPLNTLKRKLNLSIIQPLYFSEISNPTHDAIGINNVMFSCLFQIRKTKYQTAP